MELNIRVEKISMETIFLRFPHLSDQIFDNLDCQNVLKCIKVSKNWRDYIYDKQKKELIKFVCEIRKQSGKICNNEWFEDMNNTPINVLKQHVEVIRERNEKLALINRVSKVLDACLNDWTL